jgi:hypothetical protein
MISSPRAKPAPNNMTAATVMIREFLLKRFERWMNARTIKIINAIRRSQNVINMFVKLNAKHAINPELCKKEMLHPDRIVYNRAILGAPSFQQTAVIDICRHLSATPEIKGSGDKLITDY